MLPPAAGDQANAEQGCTEQHHGSWFRNGCIDNRGRCHVGSETIPDVAQGYPRDRAPKLPHWSAVPKEIANQCRILDIVSGSQEQGEFNETQIPIRPERSSKEISVDKRGRGRDAKGLYRTGDGEGSSTPERPHRIGRFCQQFSSGEIENRIYVRDRLACVERRSVSAPGAFELIDRDVDTLQRAIFGPGKDAAGATRES